MDFQVPTFFIGFLFILNLQGTFFSPDQNVKLKYCLVKNSKRFEWLKPAGGACPILNNLDSELQEIECILATDRSTCLRYLINNQTDFMIAEPQDLLILAMNKFDDHILVTAELKELALEDEKGLYSMVVPAGKSIENLLQTKKKRFCSSGFDPNFSPQTFIKYFENKILPRQCDPEKTVLENRMSGLSEYFDGICFTEKLTWQTSWNDVQLKKYYENLHLCCGKRNNSVPCSAENRYSMKSGAAGCFLHEEGELAWTTLEYVRFIFKLLHHKRHEFHYICPNGTATDEPCIWLNFPWQTIITKADSAQKVMKFIENLSSINDVERSFYREPYKLDKFKTPTDYLQDSFPEFLSTKDHTKCSQDRTVKWCVVTKLEMEKCKWISYSARVYEIEPLIECVQEISKEKCIKSIRNGWNDIFAIKSQLLSEAKMEGLKPLLHMVGNQTIGINEVAVMVPDSSEITSLEDLKNAKACFGGYANYGWNYFIYLMQNITGDNDWFCKDKKMVSGYFKESCVADLNEKNITFPKNLYSLCSKISEGKENLTCTKAPRIRRDILINPSDLECKTADDAMLRCLTKHDADVTFVNISSLKRHSPLWRLHYNVLCISTSISYNNESNMCYASWRNYGSLMVHENLTQTRKDEIYRLMMDLNKSFTRRRNPLISLYSSFRGERGVIFPEGTESLEPECNLRCSWDYNEIIEYISTNTESCDTFSTSKNPKHFVVYLSVLSIFLIFIMLTSFVVYVYVKYNY